MNDNDATRPVPVQAADLPEQTVQRLTRRLDHTIPDHDLPD